MVNIFFLKNLVNYMSNFAGVFKHVSDTFLVITVLLALPAQPPAYI